MVSTPNVWGTIDKWVTQGLQPWALKVFCHTVRGVNWCKLHVYIMFGLQVVATLTNPKWMRAWCIKHCSFGCLECCICYCWFIHCPCRSHLFGGQRERSGEIQSRIELEVLSAKPRGMCALPRLRIVTNPTSIRYFPLLVSLLLYVFLLYPFLFFFLHFSHSKGDSSFPSSAFPLINHRPTIIVRSLFF